MNGYIPVGTHIGRVRKSQLGKSGQKGSPRLEVLFEDEAGNQAWWHGYLHTEKTFDRTMESLEALGWDPGAHAGDLSVLHGTDLLVGAHAEIVVEDASYDADGRHVEATRVSWVNGVGAGRDAMPEEEARAFASSLRARVLARKSPRPSARRGPARPPARASAPSVVEPIRDRPLEDDIPF